MAKFDKWRTEEGLTLIEGWAKDGLVDEQIAKKIGISKTTFYDWKNKFPEFSEALKKGKDVIDREVENALLKRALGYDTEEVTTEYDEELKAEKVIKRVKKKVPGDTTAMIYWLNNRKPGTWRNKQDVNADVNVKGNVTIEEYLKDNKVKL